MATSDEVLLLADTDQNEEACDELSGIARSDYRDEEGRLIVTKNDALHITQQTKDGKYFIVEGVISGNVGKVPIDIVDIVDFDSSVASVSNKKELRSGGKLARRPGLEKGRQRPVSLRSRAELVNSLPSLPSGGKEHHPLDDLDDTETTQGSRLSRCLAFEKGSLKRPFSKERAELVESDGHVYTTDHPLVDLDILPSEQRPRSIYFHPMASPTKKTVVVATSPVECSSISTLKNTAIGEAVSEAASPGEWIGLMGSQSCSDDRPEFEAIKKLNIVSVSGVDREGRPVIVVSAVRLPPLAEIDHQMLLEYGLYALDKYAESDYTLVYFHYGLTSKNKPGYNLLIQMYKHLDRKYKKNLKKLYVVHPTTFIKTMYHLLKPFLSYKFGKKLTYINRLEELSPVIFLNQIDIPSEVRMYDLTLSAPTTHSGEPNSVFYDPVANSTPETQQFGVPLEVLQSRNHGIPIPVVMETCISYLKNHGGLDKVGIFRRSPSALLMQEIKARFNEGQTVDLAAYNDPHVAATLLKLFLRELPEPLLTVSTYNQLRGLKGLSSEARLQTCQEIVEALPPLNREVLHYLFLFVKDVVSRSELNKMTEMNMAIVLGPNLIWSSDVTTLSDIEHINSFTFFLIKHTDAIFK